MSGVDEVREWGREDGWGVVEKIDLSLDSIWHLLWRELGTVQYSAVQPFGRVVSRSLFHLPFLFFSFFIFVFSESLSLLTFCRCYGSFHA